MANPPNTVRIERPFSWGSLGVDPTTTKGLCHVAMWAIHGMGYLFSVCGKPLSSVAPIKMYLSGVIAGYAVIDAMGDCLNLVKACRDLWRARNRARVVMEAIRSIHEQKLPSLSDNGQAREELIQKAQELSQAREAQAQALQDALSSFAFLCSDALALVSLLATQAAISLGPLRVQIECASLIALALGSLIKYYSLSESRALQAMYAPSPEGINQTLMAANLWLVSHRYVLLAAFGFFAACGSVVSLGVIATAVAAVAPIFLLGWHISSLGKAAQASTSREYISLGPASSGEGGSNAVLVKIPEEERDGIALVSQILSANHTVKPIGNTGATFAVLLKEVGMDGVSEYVSVLTRAIQTLPGDVWLYAWQFFDDLEKGKCLDSFYSCCKVTCAVASLGLALAAAMVITASEALLEALRAVKATTDLMAALLSPMRSWLKARDRSKKNTSCGPLPGQGADARSLTHSCIKEFKPEPSKAELEIQTRTKKVMFFKAAADGFKILFKGAVVAGLYYNPLWIRLMIMGGGLGVAVCMTTALVLWASSPYRVETPATSDVQAPASPAAASA